MTDEEVMMLWVYAGEKWRTFTIPADPQLRAVKMTAWQDELGDLEARHVRAALVALGPRDWPPTTGQLRETALDLMRVERGEPAAPDGDEAWREVRQTIGRVGRYGTPGWSHPAVAATVNAIGWRELCNSTDEGVTRGQFARLYQQARTRLTAEANPPAPALAALYQTGAMAAVKRADDAIGAGG